MNTLISGGAIRITQSQVQCHLHSAAVLEKGVQTFKNQYFRDCTTSPRKQQHRNWAESVGDGHWFCRNTNVTSTAATAE